MNRTLSRILLAALLAGVLSSPAFPQVLVHPVCFQSGGNASTLTTTFDGTTDYYEIDSAAQGTNSTEFMASFWIKRTTDGVLHRIICVVGGSQRSLSLHFDASDNLVVTGRNTSDTIVVWFKTSAGDVVTADSAWHHVLISFNTASGDNRKHVYVDDVSQTLSTTTFTTNGVVRFASSASSNRIWIGALDVSGPVQELDACLSEMWVSMGGDSFDISVTANRRRFIDASGNPVYVGTDGRLATGKRPHLYFPAGDPTDNRGTDPDFTQMGDKAACGDSPG